MEQPERAANVEAPSHSELKLCELTFVRYDQRGPKIGGASARRKGIVARFSERDCIHVTVRMF